MKDEVLKLALEALSPWMDTDADHTEQHAAYYAIKQALAAQQEHEPENEPYVSLASVQEPVACGACNGSGRIARDPDIGTDQECFVCDGAGVPAAQPAPVQEPIGYFTVNDYDMWEQIDGTSGKPLYDHPAAQPAPVQPMAHIVGEIDHTGKVWKPVQPAPVQTVACFIGAKGSAFDAPETKRAYTYKEQPGNTVAYKLGSACDAASKQSAGDGIDRGLGLLQELQKEGFGVFDLGAEYTAAQPAVPLTDEQISAIGSKIFPSTWNTRHVEFARAIQAKLKEKNT